MENDIVLIMLNSELLKIVLYFSYFFRIMRLLLYDHYYEFLKEREDYHSLLKENCVHLYYNDFYDYFELASA